MMQPQLRFINRFEPLKSKVLVLVLLCAAVLPLSGCWDSKEVQSINFITALGIDYAEDHYIAYAQVIDFSSIAKQEGPSQREDSEIWIGQGKGTTLNMAINDLYRSSQQQTLWTHVKAIVLSENALNSKLTDIFDTLLHSGQLRYTPWIYGTKEEINKVLSPSALLNQSMQTIELFEPMKLYKQYSSFEPIRLHQLLDGFREPASTILVPSITSVNTTWVQGERKPPLIQTDGFYVVSGGHNQGRIEEQHAFGARYVKYGKVYQYPLYVYAEDKKVPLLSLSLRDPRTIVKAVPEGNGIRFDLTTLVNGSIIEDHGKPSSVREMERLAAQQIQKDIRHTFKIAQSRRVDAYGLAEHLYRHNPELWKKHARNRANPVTDFKLGKVEVQVNIMNASTYKYNSS
ncbi:Ger(x)C family spore germination protein [Paenibacillus sp. FSL W8-0426]|uniref:Ger(x)C family spore germination protein n=1 Tax=Paenibacillus sp. FSL W8-0426 TaxID=2921714 RepID=UPI0030D8B65F